MVDKNTTPSTSPNGGTISFQRLLDIFSRDHENPFLDVTRHGPNDTDDSERVVGRVRLRIERILGNSGLDTTRTTTRTGRE